MLGIIKRFNIYLKLSYIVHFNIFQFQTIHQCLDVVTNLSFLFFLSVFIVNQHTQNKLKIGVWYKFSGFSFLLLFKLLTYWVGKGFRIRHYVPSSVHCMQCFRLYWTYCMYNSFIFMRGNVLWIHVFKREVVERRW